MLSHPTWLNCCTIWFLRVDFNLLRLIVNVVTSTLSIYKTDLGYFGYNLNGFGRYFVKSSSAEKMHKIDN